MGSPPPPVIQIIGQSIKDYHKLLFIHFLSATDIRKKTETRITTWSWDLQIPEQEHYCNPMHATNTRMREDHGKLITKKSDFPCIGGIYLISSCIFTYLCLPCQKSVLKNVSTSKNLYEKIPLFILVTRYN